MERLVYLRSSPREVDGLLRQVAARDKRNIRPAAMICATLCNINRSSEQHPDPYTIEDFLPGESEEMSSEEFADKVLRGEEFEVDLDAIALFRKQMQAAFGNLKGGEITNVGPRGIEKIERHSK